MAPAPQRVNKLLAKLDAIDTGYGKARKNLEEAQQEWSDAMKRLQKVYEPWMFDDIPPKIRSERIGNGTPMAETPGSEDAYALTIDTLEVLKNPKYINMFVALNSVGNAQTREKVAIAIALEVQNDIAESEKFTKKEALSLIAGFLIGIENLPKSDAKVAKIFSIYEGLVENAVEGKNARKELLELARKEGIELAGIKARD